MTPDEIEIRQLVATWMEATRRGDAAAVLDLMTDDVVFLVPGRPPMDKAAFAAASQPAGPRPRFEGRSEIQEIKVIGDWAFMWTKLEVTVHPPGGAPPVARAGHTLSVLRKENGRWRLTRDANLLAPIPKDPAG